VRLAVVLFAMLASAAVASRAAVAEPLSVVPGARGAGPSRYDRVTVQRFGPPSARTVLVLTPGSHAGAGVFTLLARDLVQRVRGLQIWAADRREQAFEDTSALALGDPDQALAYYLHGAAVAGRTFAPPPATSVGYMSDWGLGLLLGDLRHVVRAARRGGRRRVILGGHSMGASVAEAYAAWNFGGRIGARDLAGLVLLDGGLTEGQALDGGTVPTLAEARAELRELPTKPRDDVLDIGLPWAYGALSGVSALYALRSPESPAALQSTTLIPSKLQPSFPATNASWLGQLDAEFNPPRGAARAHAGHPAADANPRPWVDGDYTPVSRLAAWLAQTPVNTVDWYTPNRLLLDVRAAASLTETPVARLLGLRIARLNDVRLPIYAFQTSSFGSAVLRGATGFARRSRAPERTLARDPLMTHAEPLTAVARANTALTTLVPFLRRIVSDGSASRSSQQKRGPTSTPRSSSPRAGAR
jgi:hypothetical protein